MTDNDFLLRVLEHGGWHSRDQILALSMRERGCGLTVHSRAADLRARGHVVDVEVRGGSRRASFYRLGALGEASASIEPPAGVSPSASIPVVTPRPTDRGGALLSLFDTPRGAYGGEV